MSLSIVQEEILLIQKSIHKSFDSFDSNKLDTSISFDSLIDSLVVLDNFTLTANIIHDTKIGSTVHKLRSKCIHLLKNNEINVNIQEKINTLEHKAKNLILKWKKIVESSNHHKNEKSNDSKHKNITSHNKLDNKSNEITEKNESNITSNIISSTITSTTTLSEDPNITNVNDKSSEQDTNTNVTVLKSSKSTIKLVFNDNTNNNMIDRSKLPQQRQKVIDNLISIFESINYSKKESEILCLSIENAIHNLYPIAKDSKSYANKCRTLAFNLKKNEILRNNLKNNILSPHELVSLSPNELATTDITNKRHEIDEKAIDERRSDWYDVHRSEILKTNDIDPNNTWLYDNDDDSGSEPDVAGD